MIEIIGGPVTACDARVQILLAGGPEFAGFAGEQPDATLGRCKSCRALIWWGTMGAQKKPHPFNSNGDSHFSTCPHADKWRADDVAREAAAKDQKELF